MFRYFLLLLLPLTIFAVKLSQESTQIVISPDDPYWTDECKRETVPQSPINLKPPFTFMDFTAEFNFHEQIGGKILNDGGFNLKMDGDFGNFKYNGQIFNSYELSFKAPSEHTFGPTNKRFALEMQIASISPEGVRIMLAIMFSTSEEDGEFIANFGFGDGLLQHLTTNQYYEVKKPIDLTDVIPTDNKFFIYSGTKTTPPCEPALWFIAYQTYKVSDAQLNDFPKQLLYKDREVTIDQREVYSTFDPKKESQTTTANSNATADSSSQTSADTAQQTSSSKAKSQNVDSFEIVGDDTPYGEEIYPALKDIPNPRPLKNEDYIVVTSAGDPRPYLDFLKLNTDKVNTLLNELEDEKVTKNMERAKKDFAALDASGLVDQAGAVEGQADMDKLDSVLEDLSLTGKDDECTIADILPEPVASNADTDSSVSTAVATSQAAMEAVETIASSTTTESIESTGTPSTTTESTSTTTTTSTPDEAEGSVETTTTETTETTTTTSEEPTETTETTETPEAAEPTETVEATEPTETTETESTEPVEATETTETTETPEPTDTTETTEPAAFLGISELDLSPKNGLEADGGTGVFKEKVVSVIQHRANRDPSAFFSDFHKNSVMTKSNIDQGFLPVSFMELNSNSKAATVSQTALAGANSVENFSAKLQNLRSVLSNADLGSGSTERLGQALRESAEQCEVHRDVTHQPVEEYQETEVVDTIESVIQSSNGAQNGRPTTQGIAGNADSEDPMCEIFHETEEPEVETEEDLALKAQTREDFVNKLRQSMQASANPLPEVAERNQEEAESLDDTATALVKTDDAIIQPVGQQTDIASPETSPETTVTEVTTTTTETLQSGTEAPQNEEYSLRYSVVSAPSSTPSTPVDALGQSQTQETSSASETAGPELPPASAYTENPLSTPATPLETELDSTTEEEEQNQPVTNAGSASPSNGTVTVTNTTTTQTVSAPSAGQQTANPSTPSTGSQPAQTAGSDVSKTYLRGARPIPETEDSSSDDDEEIPPAVQGEGANIERGDIELAKDLMANETVQEETKVIYGPKVPAKVRRQIDSDGGRGVMAYNKAQKWDGFNILETTEWPALCKLGESQSPINVDFGTKFKLEPSKVTFNYVKPENAYSELKNDGYKIVLLGDFGTAKYGDHPFFAEEVHFHYPSEHTFGENMERTDMELQIVHRDNYGLTIVVAVFLKVSDEGGANSFLSDLGFVSGGLADNLLGGASVYIESSKVDLAKLVDGAFDYIKYEGSLTTPPCSQNVQWFLFNKRVQVGKENINKYKSVLGQESNIRGVQPVGDRDLWIF